jgi:hypothetical protein
MSKVINPLVHNVIPGILAEEIMGVQPMMLSDFLIIDLDPGIIPEGHVLVDVKYEIKSWIEEQPVYLSLIHI